MNQDDKNKEQEPAEALADLEVSADEADKTNAGGKVQMQDFHFVMKMTRS